MNIRTRSPPRVGQQRLTVQKTQPDRMDMTVKCPSCGYDNRKEANYCLKCGLSIVEPPRQMPEAMRPLPMVAAEAASRAARCSFHPFAAATYLCGRCGRPLCRSCARSFFTMVLCPLCSVGPVQPSPWLPFPAARPPYPLTMSTW